MTQSRLPDEQDAKRTLRRLERIGTRSHQEWPADYSDRLTGDTCALCTEGRPDETPSRIRFYASDTCDAYLHSSGVQRGFATLIWRRGHVVEPTELPENQAIAFWLEALRVGRAMQTHYRPFKMNYELLGNATPHLHWLLAPRFIHDVAPGQPLPADGYEPFPEAQLRADVTALRELLRSD